MELFEQRGDDASDYALSPLGRGRKTTHPRFPKTPLRKPSLVQPSEVPILRWDPFLAAAEQQLGVRVLTDGKGLVANTQFYLAARPYAEQQPKVVQAIIDELGKLDAWAAVHPKEVAETLAPQVGLDVATTRRATDRFAYGIQPVNAAVAAQQQQVADAFYQLKLIPKAIRVADALPVRP